MNDKNIPPPPVLPPNSFKIKDDYCLFHKGDIIGKEIYTCYNCKQKYCMDCAKKAKSAGYSCAKCKHLILI